MTDREKLFELLQYGMDKYFLLKFEAEVFADLLIKNGVTVQKHGRWVQSGQCNHKPCRIRNADKWTTYKCSVCGFGNGRRFNDNYCPNCGARMDGDSK